MKGTTIRFYRCSGDEVDTLRTIQTLFSHYDKPQPGGGGALRLTYSSDNPLEFKLLFPAEYYPNHAATATEVINLLAQAGWKHEWVFRET